MSLLQEMSVYGLADCEFNRGLIADMEIISYIDQNGIALDDSLNEFRNEDGLMVMIPENYWKYFKQVERY
jgi:hypothetical protein